MDLKYKHFSQERSFAASRAEVLAAARKQMGESLGWAVTETAEGFTAKGSSFAHTAVANLRVQSIGTGTKVDVELMVERAGATGFMLFDVGGYYSIQIRHWLDGIQAELHQKLSGSEQAAAIPPPPAKNKTTACIFNGCLGFIVAMFALWLLVTVVCAIVGLITGNLYLFGRGGTIEVHGVAARIVSASILVIAAWLGWRFTKRRRR